MVEQVFPSTDETGDSRGTPLVADVVASWTPRTSTGSSADAELVALTRSVVLAANPRAGDRKTITTTLRYCFEYLTHRAENELGLEPAEAFARAEVDAYKTTLIGADGTKAARCSHLKRLHPDVGLRGTTRTSAAKPQNEDRDKAQHHEQQQDPEQDDEHRHEQHDQQDDHHQQHEEDGVPHRDEHEVEEHGGVVVPFGPTMVCAITELRAHRLSPALWDTVAMFTHDAVAAVRPAGRARAQTLVTQVAYLAAWTHRQHRPLIPSVVLSGATIEAFLAEVAATGSRTDRGMATVASNLHLVRTANEIACDVERRRFTATDPKGPYTDDEIDGLHRQVSRIRNARRRHHASVVVAAVLGAGAAPGEVAWLTPNDVRVDGDDVAVALGRPGDNDHVDDVDVVLAGLDRRWVWVEAHHGPVLVAAAQAAGDAEEPFLIGGTASRRVRRFKQVLNGSTGSFPVNLDASRGRATWLVDAAASGRYPTIVDLLDAAGSGGLARFTPVVLDAIRSRVTENDPLEVAVPDLSDADVEDGVA